MSDRAYAKVQAQQKTLIGSSPKSSPLQRTCACAQHTLAGGECEECRQKREGTMQRAAVNSAPVHAVPQVVHSVLSSPGQPLDAGTRTFMEPRFGHNFSQVRVHTDERAVESTRAVNALAYTVGQNIVFGAGQFAPGTDAGRRLLVHELAHVVQQKQSIPEQHISRQKPIINLSQEGDVEEIEARRAANEVTMGQKTTISAFPPKSAITLMRLPPPIPATPEAPPRLSDTQLKQRADQIYEQAVSAHLNQEGKPITKGMLGSFKKELTVGVLQGVKSGKVVTMVNGHNPEFAEFVKTSLKPGEEYIESIEAIPENVRTGQPRKSGHVYVHAEQVLASEAKLQGVSDARVGTSNNACNELCMSNLRENYPEVLHVNPAKTRKTPTIVEPAQPSKISSGEAGGVETSQAEKGTGKPSAGTAPKPPVKGSKPSTESGVEPQVAGTKPPVGTTGKEIGEPSVEPPVSPGVPVRSQLPKEEVSVHGPPLAGAKPAVKPEVPAEGAMGTKVSPSVPKEGFTSGTVRPGSAIRAVGLVGVDVGIAIIGAWLQSKVDAKLFEKDVQALEPAIRGQLSALEPQMIALRQRSLGTIYANITVETLYSEIKMYGEGEGGRTPSMMSYVHTDLKSVRVSLENIRREEVPRMEFALLTKLEYYPLTYSVPLNVSLQVSTRPPAGTGAYAASLGLSLSKVDRETHWGSQQERRAFILDYIRYARENSQLRPLYEEAVKAYPTELKQ